MKSLKSIVLLSLFVVLCSCSSRRTLTECDHPSGWCKEIRDISDKSWKYAQLSKNVYNKPFQFNLDQYFEKVEDFENKEMDFYATLYKDKLTGMYVFVFRGTDSLKDFSTGNNPVNQKQNKYGLEIFDQCRSKYNFKECVVTGHSLGGGIATHISLNREAATAYTFNRSPVFRNKKNIKNNRYTIVENGEILKAARLFGREPNQLYTSIGCSKGNPIKQHDMKNLAECLTKIAAFENSEAKESLTLNHISTEWK
ncbi:alpha/beta hydrolase family protein [Chryseobacterium daecheongense]|uniref:DUF2974 domain-containing protein n=1 Tax=Chryseobacterium daecheongense TaxID=192389 RepID=A0ABY2G1Q0_9FLAO|nr:hypothetical protein [Chryseobacterium daecheongense]TDX95479.1 Protein of unknown function (DUF2974) [Chryseobacterium daecheongense]